MILFGKSFEVQKFNLASGCFENINVSIVDQLSGPYGEDFVTVQYDDMTEQDMSVSSFVKMVVKEIKESK